MVSPKVKIADPEIHKAFVAGEQHGMQSIICDMLDRSGKLTLLQSMFQEAARKKDDREWQAYAEGIRHAVNILVHRGTPMGGFESIINKSMNPFTLEKDIPPTI